ncbi:hypothetical protein C8A00DRAFT_42486 [Chaetomidium leptoderma]|uniref:Uncharacterized protein n=1 Tax=Chaetomidium leptoderma TaxID=669021 RepID=A0AAN6ZZM8_9PEZI|nr:hypothetical protein C8A00DRAFT_42486 [Chaetomidium leptoderma]
MSSSESSTPDRTPQPYTLVVADPGADEPEVNHTWMMATVIEDDDLMFGGKPLCAWYEEDRRRMSSNMDEEEETRGRQRERVRVDNHHHQMSHHQHQHQHQPQHHRHHSKKSKETKE